jgi:branched-chain amino acid transport system substrate-binding protein
MQLLWAALKKTNGNSEGPKLIAAMKGHSWNSVRGPVTIDPATRDIVQTVYIRKAEQRADGVFNVEFDKVEKFKDPGVE